MFLSLSMQYPFFFSPLVFVILLFFHCLLVFFACSDSLFELGAPWREWLCLHSSQELAALGVPSPESCVSGGFNLCFFFFFFPHCITYELCCLPLWDWELRLMSTEHSSGYFVAAQRNSEGRQKLFRALTLASGGEMTWNITSDFLLKTLSTDTVKWQNQSQRKNVSMSQFGSWILHTPSKTKLKSALPPKPGSREVEPMLL